ncbi:unnamed protein product, partial [Symbiodinium sp. KB8]
MHGQFAGSRGDGVEGELEQRAGEGPLSCDSDEPQEGGRLGTPAATNLNSEYDEVASRWCQQQAELHAEAIADDLYPARVGHGDGEIHAGKANIASDLSTSLLADPGDSSLERESAGAGGRAGCSVVAGRVKQTTTGAEPGRERQAAEEEHLNSAEG